MKTTSQTTCSSCGAANPDDATFCWRCQTRFSASTAQRLNGGYARMAWDTRAATQPSPKARFRLPRPRGFWSWVRWVILGLIVLIMVNWYLGEMDVQMPDSVGSATRQAGSGDARAEEMANRMEDIVHAPTDVGIYEDPSGARFTVVATALGGAYAMPELEAYAHSARGTGQSVDLGRAHGFQSRGVDFACAPTVAPMGSYLCAWTDGERTGFVFGDGASGGQVEAFAVSAQIAIAD